MTTNTLPDKSIFLDASGKVGIVLVHGLGGTPVELKLIAKGLNRRGFAVLCCQLDGHCGSEEDIKAATWRDWSRSVERAFDTMRSRFERVYVGGLSMGAILSLDLAINRGDEVEGLLLFAPTLFHDGWSIPWYSFLLDILIDTPIGQRFSFVEREPYGIKDKKIRYRILAAMERGDSSEAGLLGTPSQAVKQMWHLNSFVRHRLKKVVTPALILHAREDDIASLKNAVTIAKSISSRAEVIVLEDSYHLITIDRQRDLVIERSAQFIEAAEQRHKKVLQSSVEPLSAAND